MKLQLLVLTTLLAAGTTACGMGADTPTSSQTSSSYQTVSSSSGTTVTDSGTSASASPTPTTGTSPAEIFTVGATGYTSTSVTVSTGVVLNIEFAPGVQNAPVAGTGYYAQYSMLGVHIVVGSDDQATPMLSNGYGGSTAQNSGIMNFSSGLPCANSTSTTCRANVTITIDKPNNNFYCLNYDMYCGWAQVYYNQPWNGTLTVQTDDTVAI
jgi:hypothetical protein